MHFPPLRCAIALALLFNLFLSFSTLMPAAVAGEKVDPSDPRSVPVATLDEAIRTGRIPQESVKAAETDSLAPVVVKVHLPAPFQPEGELPPGDVEAQRIAIQEAQNRVLADLDQHRVEDVKQYETIPWLAMQADMKTLLALVQNRDIFRIVADGLNDLHLGNSVPLIGGNLVQQSLGNAGAGQTVAIIDSGVDSTHPFLAGKVAAEGCFSTSMPFTSSNLCPNGDSTDPGSAVPCTVTGANCGHGTHVAGIATGNNTTQPGVAPLANIIAVQVFSDYGNAISAYDSDVIQGLEHVYSLRNSFKIAAVNLSLGGKNEFYTNQATCDDDHEDHKNVIDNLKSAGIATVASSGNFAFNFQAGVAGPSCVSSAISVGATMGNTAATEAIGVWPNTPPATGGNASQTASFLDLLAPGTNINSSIPVNPTNNFGIQTGTSMAAPHVAGAFAVLQEADPYATVAEYLSVLQNTGVPIIDNRPATPITTSRIQLDAAVEFMIERPLNPTIQQVTPLSGTEIEVSWNDNSLSETGFEVIASPVNRTYLPTRIVSVPPATTSVVIGVQLANDGTLLDLYPDEPYEIIVEACGANGNCSPTAPVTVWTLDTLPSQPVNLRYSNLTDDGVLLEWDYTGANPVDYFRIYRIFCPELEACDSWWWEVPASQLSLYTSAPEGNWSLTTWKVEACNADGHCSLPVSGGDVIQNPNPGSPPAAPDGLHVCGQSGIPFEDVCPVGALTLYWDDNATNEERYEFLWTIASIGGPPIAGSDWTMVELAPNSGHYTMPQMTSGLLYYFKVRACNIYGCSGESNIVNYTMS